MLNSFQMPEIVLGTFYSLAQRPLHIGSIISFSQIRKSRFREVKQFIQFLKLSIRTTTEIKACSSHEVRLLLFLSSDTYDKRVAKLKLEIKEMT